MRTSILHNLIGLYRLAADFTGIPSGETLGLSWVRNKPDFWPSSAVGNITEENIPEIAGKMDTGVLPPFLITPGVLPPGAIKQFRSYGIREILKWEGMYLEPRHYLQPDYKLPSFQVKSVSDQEMLKDWVSIVREVMLPNKKLSPDLVKGCMRHSKIQVVIGYANQKPVSTGMAYLNNKTSGIYFIATLPEYQRQGFAKMLVSRLIEESFGNGAEQIILHSSSAGEKVYLRLGFVPDGPLSTFWKVGKY